MKATYSWEKMATPIGQWKMHHILQYVFHIYGIITNSNSCARPNTITVYTIKHRCRRNCLGFLVFKSVTTQSHRRPVNTGVIFDTRVTAVQLVSRVIDFQKYRTGSGRVGWPGPAGQRPPNRVGTPARSLEPVPSRQWQTRLHAWVLRSVLPRVILLQISCIRRFSYCAGDKIRQVGQCTYRTKRRRRGRDSRRPRATSTTSSTAWMKEVSERRRVASHRSPDSRRLKAKRPRRERAQWSSGERTAGEPDSNPQHV